MMGMASICRVSAAIVSATSGLIASAGPVVHRPAKAELAVDLRYTVYRGVYNETFDFTLIAGRQDEPCVKYD